MSQNNQQFSLPIVVEPCEEGGFFASCPDLQGCHAEGETYTEAVEILEDVAAKQLSLRKRNGEDIDRFLANKQPVSSLHLSVAI